MKTRRGFSRADAVGLLIVGVLVVMMVPTVWAQGDGRQKELKNRATCASNLRSIVQSMNVYGNDFQDAYPTLPPPASATTYSVAMKAEEGENTVKGVLKTLYADNSHSSNPLNNLWLLALRGDVGPKAFMCPSDKVGNKMAMVSTRSDKEKGYPLSEMEAGNYYRAWQDQKNVSYSMMYPWTEREGVYKAWSATIDASLPVMSDMAPYLGNTNKEGKIQGAMVDPAALKKVNSDNHQGEGQNVAFGENHVEFARAPNCGNNNESIWGIRKGAGNEEEIIEAGKLPHAVTGSMGNYDTVMVPMRDGNGELR